MKNDLINVSEKVIEDILVADKHILAEVLSLEYSDLSILARQKSLNSGILDLLYVWKDELLLIELKVVPFYNGVIEQINGYYNDLLYLQSVNRLISTNIRKLILVPYATKNQIEFCKANNIILIVFDVKLILERYYQNFKKLTSFMNIKSGDYGVVRLGLLNSTLQLLSKGNSVKEISAMENRNEKTIKNRLSVSTLLGLTGKSNKEYFLTELGTSFINLAVNINDKLSEQQKDLLREFISSHPFYSTITYTVFSLVESVFTLSKSNYPVPREALTEFFVKSVGKDTEWNTAKAKETATYIFSNYAVEMDLLSKVANEFYLTPNGIKSVLLMQLHRSIKLIENNK